MLNTCRTAFGHVVSATSQRELATFCLIIIHARAALLLSGYFQRSHGLGGHNRTEHTPFPVSVLATLQKLSGQPSNVAYAQL
eukprot:COSAG02_NODE_8605_length_2507_cov_5.761213_3_plen_82_part_00